MASKNHCPFQPQFLVIFVLHHLFTAISSPVNLLYSCVTISDYFLQKPVREFLFITVAESMLFVGGHFKPRTSDLKSWEKIGVNPSSMHGSLFAETEVSLPETHVETAIIVIY